MKKIIFVVLVVLLSGCEGGSQEPIIIEDENLFVETGTGFIESGHVVNTTPCHNDAGGCGGTFWVKVYAEYDVEFEVTGSNFSLESFVDLPYDGCVLYHVRYYFYSIGTYTGTINIKEDYIPRFIIYMNGEKD